MTRMKTRKQIAEIEARHSLDRMVGLLTSGLEAAEGARITMEAWCAEERDPCNNDNYCRLLDWVKDVQRALGKQPNDRTEARGDHRVPNPKTL